MSMECGVWSVLLPFWRTDHSPHSLPPAPWVEEGEKTGSEAKPKKWEVLARGGIFRLWFCFSLCYSSLMINWLISPRGACFAHDSYCEGSLLICPYLTLWALCCVFSALPIWERQWLSRFGGHPASNHGQPTTPGKCLCSLTNRMEGEQLKIPQGTSSGQARATPWHRHTPLSPTTFWSCVCNPSARFLQACHAWALRLWMGFPF